MIRGTISVLRFLFHYPEKLYRAKYLSWWEKATDVLSINNRGLVIDGRRRINRRASFNHCLVVGSSGVGKSSVYSVSNLIRLADEDCSIICNDPSGELVAKVGNYLTHKKNFRTLVFNLSDAKRSIRWNPLTEVQTYAQISRFSDLMVRTAYGRMNSSDQFWLDGARSWLRIALRALKSQPEHYNLHNLKYITDSFGAEGASLYDFMEQSDTRTYEQFRSFAAKEPRIVQGFLASASESLSLLEDPTIAHLTSSSDIELSSLRRQKTALFIVYDETDVTYLSYLLNIFLSLLFQMAMKMPEKGKPCLPLYFILDEVATLGAIPDMEIIISTARKRSVSLSLLVQGLEQLYSVYGKDKADTIIGNCYSKIFYTGLNVSTCKQLESIIGRTIFWDEQTGREYIRPLMAAEEIRMLNAPDQALFLHGAYRPALLNLTPFYKQRRQRRITSKESVIKARPLEPLEYVSLTPSSS